VSGWPDGWIGVDLDGVLAEWSGIPEDVWRVGAPIPRMIERVKAWLADGRDVRIFTARVGCCGQTSTIAVDDEAFAAHQRELIVAWCQEHLGAVLPVTATKDFQMIELWDDHCVQMVPNTGQSLAER